VLAQRPIQKWAWVNKTKQNIHKQTQQQNNDNVTGLLCFLKEYGRFMKTPCCIQWLSLHVIPGSSCRFWRVLTMVYNTQNRWVPGVCPSSGIQWLTLALSKGTNREVQSLRLALSKGPNRVGASLSPRLRMETDPVSEELCFLDFRIPNDGHRRNPVILTGSSCCIYSVCGILNWKWFLQWYNGEYMNSRLDTLWGKLEYATHLQSQQLSWRQHTYLKDLYGMSNIEWWPMIIKLSNWWWNNISNSN
jgi:hypothetical protein